MLQPIQIGNELVCRCGCGVVVGIVEEDMVNEIPQKFSTSLPIFLLGSALEKNVKYSMRRTREQLYEERVLLELSNITKKYNVPERFAFETFNQLKKNKRGFRSEKEPIKQLIRILSKDENYFFIKQLRLLKADYENLINH